MRDRLIAGFLSLILGGFVIGVGGIVFSSTPAALVGSALIMIGMVGAIVLEG